MEVTFTSTVLVANKLVEVALVNTAVEAPVVPIGVLLIVPPSMVRPFVTIASAILLFGRFNAPETYKLVEVTDVATVFTNTVVVTKRLVEVMLMPEILVGLKFDALKFVALSVVKKPLVEVIEVASKIVDVMAVPEAEVKNSGPARVPPARGR